MGEVYMYFGMPEMQKIAEISGPIDSFLQDGSNIYIMAKHLNRMKILRTVDMFSLPDIPSDSQNFYVRA